eukprot:scaffold2974_cov194-Cylindrotheca_fusiformis.AAC.1
MSSIDRDIWFRKVVPLKSRSVDNMFGAMDEVFRVYKNHAGFRITHVDVDREFVPLLRGVKDDIKEENRLTMDFVSVDHDHDVPHAEWNNRFLKERFRTHFFRMPFKRIPHIMTRHLLEKLAIMVNFIPAKNRVSKYYSPLDDSQARKIGLQQTSTV